MEFTPATYSKWYIYHWRTENKKLEILLIGLSVWSFVYFTSHKFNTIMFENGIKLVTCLY